MEKAIFDGWRYLGLDASRILSYTPREFTIMMQAQIERHYDAYERTAIEAIMRESAHRAKKPKASDLFKRPKDSKVEREQLTDMKEETARLNDWLASLTTTRKVETDD